MTYEGDAGRASSGSDAEVPDEVVEAAQVEAEVAEDRRETRPGWLNRFVWDTLWKVVAVGFVVAVGLVIGSRVQDLLVLLVISVFFALAIIPAVKYMHERWGWRRGAAVGAIYAGLILFVVLMTLVLIPAIVEFAEEVGDGGGEWIEELNAWTEDTFGVTPIEQGAADDAAGAAGGAIEEWGGEILGLASSGIGLIFDLATVAMFTFYFAADSPRIGRALLSRMPPDKQQVNGWVWDKSVEQTGGYFYSKALLMVINGVLFFGVMLLVGMPVVFALPLSVFEAFFAAFIPVVGTYIGAAVPILVTLAVQGLVAALILLGWTLLYQLVENYWLSPKLSAKTMELNGGVAFGAALAGGAIAGPMGAFMAMPVAALITAVIGNYGKSYEVVYHSKYDSPDDPPSDNAASTT